MQFQLPSTLQNELIAYDPVLKKLEQSKNRLDNASPTKKPKFPVGKPPVLIPSDVVKSADLEEAIVHINESAAPHRYSSFRRATGEFPNQNYKTHAVVYHWEGLWVAAWLPPKGKENEYVYGYTHCYKDTASTKKRLSYGIAADCSFMREDVGRSSYMVKTVFVKKQDIVNGETTRHWFLCCAYGQKGRHMGEIVRAFEKALSESLPHWSDGGGIFDRLRDGSTPFRILFPDYISNVYDEYFDKCRARYRMEPEDWVPTVDTLFTLVDHLTATSAGYRHEDLHSIRRVRHILDKPFFRKWIQGQCEEIARVFSDPANQSRKAVRAPYLQLTALAKAIQQITEIWPDCPIDYIQSNLDVLIGTANNSGPSAESKLWLRDNMPVTSYFHVLTKFYLEAKSQEKERGHKYNYDSNLQRSKFRFTEWEDTISMMNRILNAGKPIEAPKRWRLTEFHDHVQAEAWKITNPNQALPQDLFPAPVKVQLEDKAWSFFQPIDTHQLSQWGRAVRNCVGNASNYAEGVKKRQHFIVLCMIDGVPTFTVQLTVRMGLMSVDQIVAVSNRRLSADQSAAYTRAFSLALQAQEERLKSGAAAS